MDNGTASEGSPLSASLLQTPEDLGGQLLLAAHAGDFALVKQLIEEHGAPLDSTDDVSGMRKGVHPNDSPGGIVIPPLSNK